MKKLKENYWSKTPKKYRVAGDFMLGLTLVLSGCVAGSPIPDSYKVWVMFILTTVGGIGKYTTNFFKEVPPDPNEPPSE